MHNLTEAFDRSRRRILISFSIILVGLVGRAVLDKMLALRGGAELVGLWAQLQTVVDLVCGVALAGVGNGLTALAAQTRETRHRHLLHAALRMGLALSFPVMLLVGLSPGGLTIWLTGGMLSSRLFILGAVAGWIAVAPGLLSAFWLGHGRQDRVLLLASVMAVPPVAVALWMGRDLSPQILIVTQCMSAFAIALGMVLLCGPSAPARHHGREAFAEPDEYQLAPYILAGVAIGVLSPVSLLLARGIVSNALSWHDAGVMQALWRSSEWITGIAAGVLSLYFFPRLSAAYGSLRFGGELLRASALILVPAAALFLLLLGGQKEMLATMYDKAFVMPDRAAALFLLGDWVRIGSWVFLYALFAMRRTILIAVGEVLSLPLFALLLQFFAEVLTLERIGLLYLLTYLGYFAFNLTAALSGLKAGFSPLQSRTPALGNPFYR